MSPSRWRRSRSRETSSPTSCGSSPNCDPRQSRHQHEAFGVTRSPEPTGEVRLDRKKFRALNARLGFGAPRRPSAEGPAAVGQAVRACQEREAVAGWALTGSNLADVG